MSRQTSIQTTNSNSVPAPQSNSVQQDPARARNPWSYLPKIDVLELKDEFVIECDAPGLNADQIELNIENGALHVHGPVTQRYPENARFLRQEYGVGDFDREIPLGRLVEFVEVDRISASYEHGVLTIQLPKLAAAQPKRIEVKTK